VPPDQLRDQLQFSLGGAYTIERELGGGGMARVFVATDAALGRQVVVKVLPPETAEGLSAERFTREIRLAAALQDPHIVPVLTAGQTVDGLPYYTMPFVSGESLRDRMARGRVPLDEALRILRDVAEALEYAHERGVVHRDIKPENVLLSGRNALVADFGIAKAMSAARAETGTAALTLVGTSVGTPAYMAPEQAVGDPTDHRADLYAWGMMTYELLAGTHPFAEKKTQRQLVAAQVADTPAPLDEGQHGLPPGLGALVMACLAKDPSDRPADAAAVLAALATATASDGSAVASRGPTGVLRATPRGRRVILGGAAIAVLAGLAGVGSYLATRAPAGAPTPSPAEDATPAIAVLPFEHQGDTAEAYVTDGITDEIRGRLTSVRELMVIARGSSNRHAGSESSLAEIAKELDVRYLLTGTVRVLGSGAERRVVVRPELVEVTPDGREQSRWQQPFEAEFGDVVAVQTDIAGRVVAAMRLPTSVEDRLRAMADTVRDPVAYDLYLKAQARVDWGSRSDAASNLAAVPLYEAAVARDSTMVEAWGGLASALVLAYANGVPTRALEERARAAALRTLALDPAGAGGASAHGLYLRLVKRDKVRALDELRRAVIASPNDPVANASFAVALFDVGRLEEALPYFDKARRLDPRIPPRSQADVLAALGRLSDARDLASQGWSMSPAVRAAAPRVRIELAAGDTAAARRVAERAMRDLPTDEVPADLGINALGWVLGPDDVRRLLALPPEAFADGESGRALVRARHYWLQGDSARMRQWADSAQRLRRLELRDAPENTRLMSNLASAEAFRGRGEAALDLARRAIATERRLAGGAVSRNLPDLLYFAAEAAVVAGERDAALAWLGELLSVPSIYTPAYLRVDPTWTPLRGDARFETLLTVRRPA
jgi:serine/threonine-protein kinase